MEEASNEMYQSGQRTGAKIKEKWDNVNIKDSEMAQKMKEMKSQFSNKIKSFF